MEDNKNSCIYGRSFEERKVSCQFCSAACEARLPFDPTFASPGIEHNNAPKGMKEEDIKALKEWLVEHGYYVGDSAVAKSLHELADYWDD